MESNVIIQKSKRKTISLSITKELGVLIKAPRRMPDREISDFLQKHSEWIAKHLLLQKEWNENTEKNRLPEEKIRELREKAAKIAADRVSFYSAAMGVAPAGIKITSAKTRWGSCSYQNRICFSYRLALLPPEAADYIVVHELAHIRVKNHSANFYAVVAACLPDYKQRIALLRKTEREIGG